MNGGLQFAPPAASEMAGQVDALFFFMLALTGSLTLLIAMLVVYFAFRYRERDPAVIPPQITAPLKVELAWTVIPLLIFVVPFVWGARLYLDLYRPPDDTVEIHVLGKQWMWKFEHPGGQREIDTLHVPAHRAVKLIITSQDVIHSAFVPAFRAKQDALPGRYTTVSFTATKPGRYPLFCAEYCGTDHSHMRATVVVLEPAEYELWLAQGASQSLASQGAKLFQQLGCITCHRDDSLRRAPVLADVYGKPVQLTTGERVVADENYLRESILDPAAKVVTGWQPIMPPYRGRVTEEELMQLIAYIKSMGPRRSRDGALPARSQAPLPGSR